MLTILLALLAARILWTVVVVAIAVFVANQESDSGWGSVALFAIGLFPELAVVGAVEKLIHKIRY